MQETSHSLLDQIRSHADPESWERLVGLYTPLLHAWLRRHGPLSPADVDDLVQEVLLAVWRELPHFQHTQQPGAFRNWLRVTLVNRLRHFWRGRHHRPHAIGGSDFLGQLEQLEDAASQLSQVWQREHDRHVMGRLLDMVQPDFAAQTWQAFYRQVLDGVPAERVAEELHMPRHSVYAAKSRVLKALRTAAAGLVQ